MIWENDEISRSTILCDLHQPGKRDDHDFKPDESDFYRASLSLCAMPVVLGVSLVLVTADELAEAMRFDGVDRKFRAWCRALNIRPVPGRPNKYDPKHVRKRLDAAQGMADPTAPQGQTTSYVEQRRNRRDRT